MSVVGIDDIELASYAVPALTTVSQPKYEAGRQALGFLVNRLEGADTPPRRILLESHLVTRGSTAPPSLRKETHGRDHTR